MPILFRLNNYNNCLSLTHLTLFIEAFQSLGWLKRTIVLFSDDLNYLLTIANAFIQNFWAWSKIPVHTE